MSKVAFSYRPSRCRWITTLDHYNFYTSLSHHRKSLVLSRPPPLSHPTTVPFSNFLVCKPSIYFTLLSHAPWLSGTLSPFSIKPLFLSFLYFTLSPCTHYPPLHSITCRFFSVVILPASTSLSLSLVQLYIMYLEPRIYFVF